jgi:hypothetical protein
MQSDDSVEPGDAALQELLASVAERMSDGERRDVLLDFMLTMPPLADWPAEHREVSWTSSPGQIPNDVHSQKAGRHNSAMTEQSIVIAGKPVGLDVALERLERYPSRTPTIYDYPAPGGPSVVTADEIRRTRAVSSRISHVEGDWFIRHASTAPWTPPEGDLRDADPGESGGLYDMMLNLYEHFEGAAPEGVRMAKISKVLHLKRPKQFPILDSRLARAYSEAAAREAATYPSRANSRMYWAAIRSDLKRGTDGLHELRTRMSAHPETRVRGLRAVSDLRLLDMLTW